jgi:hypothetical protein
VYAWTERGETAPLSSFRTGRQSRPVTILRILLWLGLLPLLLSLLLALLLDLPLALLLHLLLALLLDLLLPLLLELLSGRYARWRAAFRWRERLSFWQGFRRLGRLSRLFCCGLTGQWRSCWRGALWGGQCLPFRQRLSRLRRLTWLLC